MTSLDSARSVTDLSDIFKILCELVDFIREHFIGTNKPVYLREFLNTRGLKNLFWIIKNPSEYSKVVLPPHSFQLTSC